VGDVFAAGRGGDTGNLESARNSQPLDGASREQGQ
jgi:hypothetical protein